MNSFLAKSFLMFTAMSGFLLSCGESPPPLLITSEYNVQKIQVLQSCTSQDEPLFLIEDRQKIEEIITFLDENDHSWEYPFGGTAPSLPYELNIFDEKQLKLVIWFGNSTLMGRTLKKNDGGVRVKYLSSKKMGKFVSSIGITSKCEQ
ncbi:MAG: hypothetical protein ACRC2S_18340 [Waterburya sp.]